MEIVGKIIKDESALDTPIENVHFEDKRMDRLLAVAAGRNSKKYFGKVYTIAEIENLNACE